MTITMTEIREDKRDPVFKIDSKNVLEKTNNKPEDIICW